MAQAFDGVANVEISQGDIFSTKPGIISAEDPIDVLADAVVSPANSFGFMDGGIDAVFTYQLGPQVQEAVQECVAPRRKMKSPPRSDTTSTTSASRWSATSGKRSGSAPQRGGDSGARAVARARVPLVLGTP